MISLDTKKLPNFLANKQTKILLMEAFTADKHPDEKNLFAAGD
jgi:hypothetical protein